MPDKNVLLIGSSGGLGRHFALGLANAGYNLALHYYNSEEKIKELTTELKKSTVKFFKYKADISNENEIADLVKKANQEMGSIDILINNAGISIDGMSWKLNLDKWNKVISVNLTGPFICIKHVLPVMRQNNWGRIINITSVVPQIGVPGTIAYSASKAGLDGITKTVSKEVTKFNITINQIALGYFKAGMLFQIPEEIREQIKASIPMKEFGDPAAILRCILYLCSEDSGYVTGQTININGGLY
jgi:NAD(P)-dependent dehydrogenase (short-subunit alcohol dehydrogenase family)